MSKASVSGRRRAFKRHAFQRAERTQSRDQPESSLYAISVLPFLDFARRHRGRRTTEQLEDVLGRFCSWFEGLGLTDLRRLTALHLRDFVLSLQGFRRSTIVWYASALRSFLAYLRLEGVLESDLAWAPQSA